MHQRRTFKDDALQKRFEEFGYVVTPFLNEEEIGDLKQEYWGLENDLGRGFHATMHSHDIPYRRKVNEIISSVFTPKADSLLEDYRHLVSNYTVKEPGTESFFDFHLDWNMVDESQYRSVTIWCPLTDTNAENGNLWVLEKSNIMGDTYRCGPGLALYSSNREELLNSKFVKRALSLKKGEAVIYDHKLFHGSPPNLTEEVRIAINQAMAPREATAMHYARLGNEDIMAFEVDDDFFCRVIIDKLELTDPIATIPVNTEVIPQYIVNNLIA